MLEKTKLRLSVIRENAQKLSCIEIGKILDMPPKSVSSTAKRYGIKIKKPKLTALNTSVIGNFNNIKHKEVAYTLGFLWADGACTKNNNGEIFSIKASILETDYLNIKKDLHHSVNWWIKCYQPPNGKPQTSFYTSDPELCRFFQDADYLLKSYNSPKIILEKIPKEIHNYFWRGFFDGDGCIHVLSASKGAKLSITSTIDYDWSSFETLLKALNIEKYRIHRRQRKSGAKSSELTILRRKYIKIFYDYLYGNEYDSIGLKRKHDKFVEFLDKNKEYDFNSERGISYRPGHKNPWQVTLKGDIYIGVYPNKNEAISARNKAQKELENND